MSSVRKRVIVMGGGVAGMSVAQELLARSGAGVTFDVQVYEHKRHLPGGKARSIPVPHSGTDGRPDLPGEHGFRFFPSFYRHLPETMRHIPYAPGRTVFDNLVQASRVEMARFDRAPIVACARFPRSLGDLETVVKELVGVNHDLEPGDLEFFAARLWQIMTSCDARRLAQYENVTWWKYLDAGNRSRAYRRLLANGLSRSLLANDPTRASARTVGDTNVQLLLGMAEPGTSVDRVLNGPTNEVWIDPWFRHLTEGQGCAYHFGTTARRIVCADGQIAGVRAHDGASETLVTGDYYVFAVPVEKMADLLEQSRTDDGQHPLALDPTLQGILQLAQSTAWMNGIQFFLRRDVPVVPGHTLYVDSPWALTSISQAQFWSQLDLAHTGDGTIHGVLSVCISDWDAPGIDGSPRAKGCTRTEIAAQIWAQLKRSLNVDGQVVLRDEDVHSWFLDPDIRDDPAARLAAYRDMEPLLINVAGSWGLRPDAFTRIPNLFLAADYVRTNTDVACMEAANEAARRAVNCLLEASGSRADWCEIWKLHEPALLAPWRWKDQERYDRGLPWSGSLF